MNLLDISAKIQISITVMQTKIEFLLKRLNLNFVSYLTLLLALLVFPLFRKVLHLKLKK